MNEEKQKLYKDFVNYFSMTYDEFCKKTTFYMPDGGCYRYCINEGDDDSETRISYLQYLRDEKHLI